MRIKSINKYFFDILGAGLWEKDASIIPLDAIVYDSIWLFASCQAVVGLVTAGLDNVKDEETIPKEAIIRFFNASILIENRNLAMNAFIADLFQKMEGAGIKALLVKGQGIAQCYERPLWRACGDVDLFLDKENYEKAKMFLTSLASHVEDEDVYRSHLAMTIGPWEVELHGTLRSGLGKRMDDMVDEVQKDTFEKDHHRIWHNESVDVCLPSPDNDVILVFSHILQHFFKGGIGLRQICDWCRLLWTFRDDLDLSLLEDRLRRMGVMTEWKAFGALAVEWLGVPVEAMPFYSSSALIRWKVRRILAFVLETGNFGHNRDVSYQRRYPYVIRKAISLWRHTWDGLRQVLVFPLDALRAWGVMIKEGFSAVGKGK